MDSNLSPRIAYWTSSFEPEMEAVAASVAMLRRHFPHSVAWGLSRRRWVLLSFAQGFCIHPRWHLVFRLCTRLLEPAFHINHIIGSLGDWFYLEGMKQRPMVLTLATHAAPVDAGLIGRVDRFIAEYPEALPALERMGVPKERMAWIPPAVDLEKWQVAPAPSGPFTILFASTPERADWFAARGIAALLDAAAVRPKMR